MGRLPALLAIMLAFVNAPLAAQTPPLDPQVPPALVRTASLDDRVTIPISIDGKGPWPFVIDTGSQRTVIARDLAQRLALPPRADVTILSMTGRSQVATVALPRLTFGAGVIDDIEAPVLEGEHLGAAGLNFRSGTMDIADSGRRRTFPTDPDTIVVEARRKRGQLILLDSRVNGMRVNIMLDTGSHYSIGNLALRDKLLRKKRAPDLLTATLTSVTGGTLIGEVGRIGSVALGRVNLTEVPVIFADASPFAELGMQDKPALLLGISALRVFDRVAIDFARGKVDFLLPDASAITPTRLAANQPADG